MGIGVIAASMALTHEAGERNPHPQLFQHDVDHTPLTSKVWYIMS